MFNFSELVGIDTSNSRTSSDLRFSAKTNKFTLSSTTMVNLDLINNGLRLWAWPTKSAVLLSVQSPERSKFLKGREGSTNKGRTFTNDELVRLLNLGSEDVEFNLVETGNHDDRTFYEIVPVTDETTLSILTPSENEDDEEEYDETETEEVSFDKYE